MPADKGDFVIGFVIYLLAVDDDHNLQATVLTKN